MNIIHITNLFRAYFIENKKTLLILCIITFGIAAFAFTLSPYPEVIPELPALLLFWVAGTFFQFALKKSNSAHFFNLPATTAEKFIHSIVTIAFVGITLHILMLAGAYTGHYLIRPLIYSGESTHIANGLSILKMSMWSLDDYLTNITVISAFLFGSIYFRKNAFIKSLAIGTGVLFGVALYFVGLLLAIFGKGSLSNGSVNIDITDFVFIQDYYYFIPIVAVLFFLSLTYLRLKETEV